MPTSFVYFLFFISFGLEIWLFCRFFIQKKPILPKQNPLRRARWNQDTLIVLLAMFFLFPSLVFTFMHSTYSQLEDPPAVENALEETADSLEENADVTEEKDEKAAGPLEEEAEETEPLQTRHPAVEFLLVNPTLKKFLLMLFYLVLLGPILEEFTFRLVLQGWLDAREREYFADRKGNGWISLLVTALFFSLIHYRSGTSEYPEESILEMQFFTQIFTSLFILTFGIYLLRVGLKLNWREIGLDFRYWRTDILLGVTGAFAALLPTYILQIALLLVLKDSCAPDFLSLLPLALVFGILYWRTRRLLPSIAAHCCFNGITVFSCLLEYLSS